MRFEAPRIHVTSPNPAVFQKLRLQSAHLAQQYPKLLARKLRFSKTRSAIVMRPPERLTRMPEHREVRPTGFDKYARRFTREGGIELRYDDIERTLPVILAKLSLWSLSCTVTYYAGCAWSPIDGFWWNLLCYLLVMMAYAVIFFRDKHVERTIEVRPDCMIIEGMDTFWKENMQLGWPGFKPNEAGHFVLGGVYGSRWIEYLTIRRMDDNDRAPELFAAHLDAAMKYQWDLPSKGV